jgi:hypothetical protein
LLFSLVFLSACSTSGDNNGGAAGTGTGATAVTESLPGGQLTTQPTGDIPGAGDLEGTPQVITQDSSESAWLASLLLNAKLFGPEGQVQARVSGIIVDAATGQVAYLVISGEGLEGREVLAPWWSVRLLPLEPGSEKTAGLRVQLEVSQDDLAGAPDFNAGLFVAQANQPAGWDSTVRGYWAGLLNGQAAPAEPVQPVLIKGEGLQSIDYDLQSNKGEQIGEIKELVLSSDGWVRYALIDFDKQASAANQNLSLVVVPWGELAWSVDARSFNLIPDIAVLQQAPMIDPTSPPDLTLPGWDRDWSAYWMNLAVETGPTQTVEASTGVVPAGNQQLLGQLLVANSGEVLGVVEDWLVVDAGVGSGQVEFIAVTTLSEPGQGKLGQAGQGNRARGINPGGEWVLVPWSVVEWNIKDATLLFLETPQIFNNAPQYEDVETLDAFEEWLEPVNAYWKEIIILPGISTQVPLTQEQASRVWISALLEKPVTSVENQPVGDVASLLLDPGANLRYLVLSDGQRFLPVPWAYFERDLKSGTLLYTDDAQHLQDAPAFASLEMAQNMTTEQESSLRTYWGLK